jgi:hypothetical protein
MVTGQLCKTCQITRQYVTLLLCFISKTNKNLRIISRQLSFINYTKYEFPSSYSITNFHKKVNQLFHMSLGFFPLEHTDHILILSFLMFVFLFMLMSTREVQDNSDWEHK